MRQARDGRATVRPLLLAAEIAVVFALGLWLRGVTSPGPDRSPTAVPNPQAGPATERPDGRIRLVTTAEAPATLVPDTLPPDGPVRLLWLDGRTAQPVRGGAVVLDGAGGILVFSNRLRPSRPAIRLEGREVVSIGAGPDGGWVLTDARGTLIRADRTGAIVHEESTPFMQPAVSADSTGTRVWLARSSGHFAYAVPPEDAPLVASVGIGDVIRPVGRARVPDHAILADLANAGHLVVADSMIVFAPFIRDEIVAMTPAGDTLWIADRALPQTTRDPRFELDNGRAVINYHPVNLGMTLGPNGSLYVLSTAGYSMTEARLDEFDPADGRLIASVHLPTAQPTLAADHAGRVYALDGIRLLSGVPPKDRERFADFDLPQLGGGRATTESLRGKVTLVNFWASWCGPCRTEMPALDSLRRSIRDEAFQMLGFNEDQDPGDASAFVADHQVRFPVLLGKGRLRVQYHLPGLPVTLVVDREGRVAGRWIGQLEAGQIADIRAVLTTELARQDPDVAAAGHHHHSAP